MRKGYRSADARLMFFEKGLLYCKLTVASNIRKELLHVSFGVVGSRCRCALKNAFLYRLALYGLKKLPFPQDKSFPFTESFTLYPQKPLVFATKTPLVRTTFYCLQKPPFHVQKPFFCTNLSLLPSKAILFCPPQPIPTALNLLSAKKFHFHKPKAFLLHKTFLFTIPSNPFLPSAAHSNAP